MLTRRIRRTAERLVEKLVNREARAAGLRANNDEFARQFSALNVEISEVNKRLGETRRPEEFEALLRALATNYKASSELLRRWADAIHGANSMMKAGR